MKILVSRGLYDEHLGGAEVEVIDFIKLLSANNFSVKLITNSPELKELVGDNATTDHISWPRQPRGIIFLRTLFIPIRFVWFYLRLTGFARRFKPDLIVAQSREDGIVFAFSKWLHHSPLLWRDHADLRHQLKTSRANTFPRIYQSILVKALKKTDAVATVSSYDHEHIAHFVDQSDLIRVIHPGTIINKSAITSKKQSSRPPVVGVVARLVEDKGVQYLIQALSGIPKSTYKLVIVGDGPYKKELETSANKLDVDANFTGYSSDPYKYYSLFDIFVQPSVYEGWTKTVIEAMLHSLPVLASDIACHKEQIEPGVDGLLFNNQRADDLRIKLAKLLADSQLRNSLGNKAQKKAQRIGDFKVIYNTEYFPLIQKLSEHRDEK